MLVILGAFIRPSRIVLEKIVTALVMPVGVLWILLFMVFLVALRRGRKGFSVLAGMIWLLFTLSGSAVVSEWLAHALESGYIQVNPLERGVFDAVVVLGGGTGVGANGRPQGNASGDRVILAAQMYHLGLTSKIICTGERIAGLELSGWNPSQSAAAVLAALGVPEDAMGFSNGRNTAEEMGSLGEQFGEDSSRRVGLITSAWHLPRALRLAAAQGFHPEALPADFKTGLVVERDLGWWLRAMVPTGDAMSVSAIVAKEYLARLAGR